MAFATASLSFTNQAIVKFPKVKHSVAPPNFGYDAKISFYRYYNVSYTLYNFDINVNRVYVSCIRKTEHSVLLNAHLSTKFLLDKLRQSNTGFVSLSTLNIIVNTFLNQLYFTIVHIMAHTSLVLA